MSLLFRAQRPGLPHLPSLRLLRASPRPLPRAGDFRAWDSDASWAPGPGLDRLPRHTRFQSVTPSWPRTESRRKRSPHPLPCLVSRRRGSVLSVLVVLTPRAVSPGHCDSSPGRPVLGARSGRDPSERRPRGVSRPAVLVSLATCPGKPRPRCQWPCLVSVPRAAPHPPPALPPAPAPNKTYLLGFLPGISSVHF